MGETRELVRDHLEGQVGWGLGGRLKREGACEHLRLIHVVVWQKPTQHRKAVILQLNFFQGRSQ